ncbi:spectinomycin phosphotransferase [Nonomuraea jiangxiensis]|uniref:Spectinomycin phosphotransferase n=1 Tax=Nonomuraea jiangxiensis TaxID=633440 RepID=A0A1G8JJ67_9ACTN|nr:spectinomycin phosphotransferase [Nonomuraea jiangxiensis]
MHQKLSDKCLWPSLGSKLVTSDYSEVFRWFGIEPQESMYLYAPVFRGVIGGKTVAVKRTHSPEAMGRWVRHLAGLGVPVVTPLAGPRRIGGYDWVAYPWIDGRTYDGSPADVRAAGELLGRLHVAGNAEGSTGLPGFEWPDHDEESVEDDVTGLDRVLKAYRPDLRGEVLGRLAPLLRSFMATTLPAIRDADLPVADVTMDFKAVNLVYSQAGPVLVDPDNGERAPRLLDLALAVLLFHNDLPDRPARLFDEMEWAAFRDAYLGHVRLTVRERELWPTALTYMLLEWGVWTAVNGGEVGDWDDPRQAAFLAALLTVDITRYPLEPPTL